jgi:hypothetical protein
MKRGLTMFSIRIIVIFTVVNRRRYKISLCRDLMLTLSADYDILCLTKSHVTESGGSEKDVH